MPEENNISDKLLNESRLSQVHNGKEKLEEETPPDRATSGQKWWAAFLIGILFAVISSPFFYGVTNGIASAFNGLPTSNGGPTLIGLIIHTLIFILIVRLLLW